LCRCRTAWLVLAVIAFNLTRAAASLTGPGLAKATTSTIRRKLISVAARVASSARRLTLHPPAAWPWQTAWAELFARVCGLRAPRRPDHPPHRHDDAPGLGRQGGRPITHAAAPR